MTPDPDEDFDDFNELFWDHVWLERAGDRGDVRRRHTVHARPRTGPPAEGDGRGDLRIVCPNGPDGLSKPGSPVVSLRELVEYTPMTPPHLEKSNEAWRSK